jgi:hypothetical protein
MVLAVSTTQTVLWDQIQYQGDAAEFAWVLPIKPGARIEQGTAAFFETLEGYTARDVQAPPVSCGGGPNIGCGASAKLAGPEDAFGAAGAGGGTGASNPVNVVHEGTVGPYETVTLHTSTPGALNTWLAQHNFNVDPSTQPVIDEYVSEGFDFIALRLQPGQGIQAMTPVRVISPGASPTLPLRMVSIGTGAKVPIVLHVIGEGRWTVSNFPEAKVQENLLAWNFADNSSNYAKLREAALAMNGGKGWLTAFAQPQFFSTSNVYITQNSGPSAFGRAYMQQAFQDKEIAMQCTLPDISTSGVVTNPCPPGEAWDSPNCGTVPSGAIDARSLGCPGADDLAVALTGMHYEDVWDTRLEAELPHDALTVDLDLKAAPDQTQVQRTLQAGIAENVDKLCGTTILLPNLKSKGSGGSNAPGLFAVALGALGLGLAMRRSRARTRLA